MTTATLTLTDFLLARIAEDEAEVRAHGSTVVGHRSACIFEGGYEGTLDCDCGGVSRSLAECASKRSMIGLLQADALDRKNAVRRDWANEVAILLAAVYADHPDYRDEWRP